jgi:hypothetical protein
VEADFVPPSFEEGFDKIHNIANTASTYTPGEINKILTAIKISPSPPHGYLQFFRNNNRSGYSSAPNRRVMDTTDPIEGMKQQVYTSGFINP